MTRPSDRAYAQAFLELSSRLDCGEEVITVGVLAVTERAREIDAAAINAHHCQNGFGDICRASQRDGITCPHDSCDIDDGVRPTDAQLQAARNAAASEGAVAMPPSLGGDDEERLAAIGELIRTQDNRITAEPIFIVQQKRMYAAHPDYDHDRIAWIGADGEADPEEHAFLEAEYQETGIEPDGWTRAAVGYYWDFVTACFSEQGCKDYLKRDGHNLREPRIYAAGSYRNDEWRLVRKHLLDLAARAAEGAG